MVGIRQRQCWQWQKYGSGLKCNKSIRAVLRGPNKHRGSQNTTK